MYYISYVKYFYIQIEKQVLISLNMKNYDKCSQFAKKTDIQ